MKCCYCGDDNGDSKLGGSCILCAQDLKRSEEDYVPNDPVNLSDYDYDPSYDNQPDPKSETIHGILSTLCKCKVEAVFRTYYDMVYVMWDYISKEKK